MNLYITGTRDAVAFVFIAEAKNYGTSFKVNLNEELNMDFRRILSLSSRSTKDCLILDIFSV